MRRCLTPLFCLCLLLISLPFGCGRGAKKDAQSNAFLWKVSSADNTVYLLGSIHAGKDDYFPLPKEIEDAFAQCKALAVEVDVSNTDAAAAAIKMGMYPRGRTLSKSVSKKTRDALHAYMAERGAKVGLLEPLKPATAAMMLVVMDMMGSGWSEEKGIDKHFLNLAKKAGTPVRELESAIDQMRFFAEMPEPMQEAFLLKSLTDIPKMNEVMEKTWTMWQAGEAKKMDEVLLAPYRTQPEYLQLMEQMIDGRNVTMLAKIEGYLKERAPVFVVVGAGHVVGDKGLVKLLEDKNYKVEQMKATFVKKAAK